MARPFRVGDGLLVDDPALPLVQRDVETRERTAMAARYPLPEPAGVHDHVARPASTAALGASAADVRTRQRTRVSHGQSEHIEGLHRHLTRGVVVV